MITNREFFSYFGDWRDLEELYKLQESYETALFDVLDKAIKVINRGDFGPYGTLVADVPTPTDVSKLSTFIDNMYNYKTFPSIGRQHSKKLPFKSSKLFSCMIKKELFVEEIFKKYPSSFDNKMAEWDELDGFLDKSKEITLLQIKTQQLLDYWKFTDPRPRKFVSNLTDTQFLNGGGKKRTHRVNKKRVKRTRKNNTPMKM